MSTLPRSSSPSAASLSGVTGDVAMPAKDVRSLPLTESAPPELRYFAGMLAPWRVVVASWNQWHRTTSEGPAWILLRNTDAAKLDPSAWTQCAPLGVRGPETARADMRDLVAQWSELDTTVVTTLALQWIGVLLVLGPQIDGDLSRDTGVVRLSSARFRPTSHPTNHDLDVETRTASLLPRPLDLGPGAWDELQRLIQQQPLLLAALSSFFLRSTYTTPAPVFPDPSDSPEDEDYGAHTWVHLGAIFRGFLRLSVIAQEATGTPLPIVPWHRQQHYDGATWDVLAAMPDLWRRPVRGQLAQWATQALDDRLQPGDVAVGGAFASNPDAFARECISVLARSALAAVAESGATGDGEPRLDLHPRERSLMRHLLVSEAHEDRELAVRALPLYGPSPALGPDTNSHRVE